MACTKSSTMVASFILFSLFLYTEAHLSNEAVDSFFPSESSPSQRWGFLVAGSKGYENYRHQSDVCHAWQVLTDKGVPQQNIVVFMYDDIAYHESNPFQGVIQNDLNINGLNVYEGVPHDYVGENVTSENIISAFLGRANPGGLDAGSKFIDNGPDDYIFFYFSGHGIFGSVGLPTPGDRITSFKFLWMLQEKQNQGFNQMLVYIEACHSETMIQFLDNNWRIYGTAASAYDENSFAAYCSPDVFFTCLGDGYSVAWMEDSDANDVTQETVGTQFDRVKARVLTQKWISHVVEYGLMDIKGSMLSVFQGPEARSLPRKKETRAAPTATTKHETMSQDQVEVWYWKGMVRRAKIGSVEREEAKKQLDDVISHRKHVDQSVIAIVRVMVVRESQVLEGNTNPMTWDWKCYEEMVATYQAECGTLREYGMKYSHVFAKLCDFGISPKQLGVAAHQICLPHLVNPLWMAEDKVGWNNKLG